MGILHMRSEESYVIIQPEFVRQGRKAVNFRGLLQCKYNAENTDSYEMQ